YNALLKAPAQDKEHLANKYAPSSQGIGNMSELLFGPKAAKWTRQGLYWYEKLAPYLAGEESEPEPERLEGVDITFTEYHPRPDFHIRQIQASVSTAKGDFDGVVLDVTHQPEIIGRPATLKFSGRDMRGMQSLLLTGRFDHVNPQQRVERLDLAIDAYKVSETDLTQAPGLRLRMDSALSDTRFNLSRINGKLDGDMNMHIRDIVYDNEAGSGEFQRVMVESFNEVKDFNIDARVTGTLGQPGLKISSDLDRRLNTQIQKAFDRRIKAYREDLNQRIEAATAKPIAEARQQVAALRQDIEGQLAEAETRLQQQQVALQNQIDAYQKQVDAEKRKAEQQVKDQLQKGAEDLLKQLGR
ncbi:MAG: TIGR03545 family protein, partial [Gammaproteobacteria bacterium]|nr:TIGR03545 family protein [Gammaproteobacteria bacterium]